MKNVIKVNHLILTTVLFLVGMVLVTSCTQSKEQGGSFSLDTQVDTTAGTIGDIFEVTVTARNIHGRILQVRQPEFRDSLSLASWTQTPLQGDSLRITYGVAVWDTGQMVIPPLTVHVLDADSTIVLTMDSEPVTVAVRSVLQGVEDRSLRPLKDPVPIRRSLPWRTLILVSLLVILLGMMTVIWRKRIRKSEISRKRIKPLLPPDKLAFQKLVEAEALLETNIEEFYVRLSYLIREYIERSFFYKTLEMTAGEIRGIAPQLPIPMEMLSPILDVLERADFIKFARQVPSYTEGKRDLQVAGDFIRATIPLWKVDLPING